VDKPHAQKWLYIKIARFALQAERISFIRAADIVKEKKKKRKVFRHTSPLKAFLFFFNYINCSNKKYYLSLQNLPFSYPSTIAATATLFLVEK